MERVKEVLEEVQEQLFIKSDIVNECLERMEILKLDKSCINAFKNGKVWESEGIGALYELNEKEQAIVDEFENEHKGYKVYHLIHNISNFGELYNILYVGTEKSEWEQEKADLKEDYAFVYVKNIDMDYCSEFGTIGIKKNIGGIIRIS